MQMPIRQPLGIRTPALFGGVEDRGGAVGVERRCRSAKMTVPPSPAATRTRPEPLGVQRQAALGVVLLEGVEQPGRDRRRRRAARSRSGTSVVEVGDVEQAVAVVVPLDQPEVRRPRERPQLVAEDRARLGLTLTCTSTMSVSTGARAGEQVAQHPDHRRDAGAGGDQQQLARAAAAGSTNSPSACSSWIIWPARARCTRWLETTPSGIALTVRLMQRSAARAVGQGVGAPQAYAVDVDADADVLARARGRPSRGPA